MVQHLHVFMAFSLDSMGFPVRPAGVAAVAAACPRDTAETIYYSTASPRPAPPGGDPLCGCGVLAALRELQKNFNPLSNLIRDGSAAIIYARFDQRLHVKL